MASRHLFTILTTFLFLLASLIEARDTLNGFTLDLIHRDSPLSPLYNPSNTRFDLITNAFRRSIYRTASLKNPSSSSSPNSDIQSDLYSIPGEYVMKISIGSPPVQIIGIADTGSDLTWTQCQPCIHCYPQNGPLFNPQHSYTHIPESCQSKLCSYFTDPSSCSPLSNCKYSMSYGDHSYSYGNLSTETFTFSSSTGQPVEIKNVAFGCGNNNKLTFTGNVSGIIGLGGGPVSIVRQLKNTIKGKFSYCLVPITKDSNITSTLYFGSRAVVSGRGVTSTPIVPRSPETYYYLNLEGIKVGKTMLSHKAYESQQANSRKGNIIIDSGTTLTMLPTELYQGLESELKKVIGGETISDPQGILSLCYKTGDGLKFPTVTLRFTGANLDLPGSSMFYEVAEGVTCLAMTPTDGLAILGNLSQADLLVGYDLVKNRVSFKRTDCTKK